MSSFYDDDRQALRLRMIEARWKQDQPSYETLSKMMSGCRDEEFRRRMAIVFEGPRRLRMQAMCDIALQIPWVPNQELSSHKLSTHGVISKVFVSVGIIVYLSLICYVMKRYFQVR